jgi:hypothetical protein
MHRCLGTCLIAQWRLKKDASKNRAKLKNSLLLARIFRAMRPFGAVQRAQDGTACQPRHAPKKCSHAPLQRRRAAGEMALN